MSFRLRHLKMVVFTALATCALLQPATAGESFKIDTGHSFINFSVAHLGIGKAIGRFNDFEGTITKGENGSDYQFSITIKADSIDTNSERRDKHLRSPDFLNANQFPKIQFESKKVTKKGDGFILEGDLTMHGATKSVQIMLKKEGEGKDPWGNFRVGYSGSTKVKRSDFNMAYGLDNGMLGDEVEMNFAIEAIRQ